MRPQLTARSEMIMQLFLERHIFESQAQVVEQALELLLENQLQKEALDDSNSIVGEEFLDAQIEAIGE